MGKLEFLGQELTYRDADIHSGGIRGIVELEILRQLEKELGDLISIQSLFDLIVGTSTGGIIALGLTARNWSV
jgi:patatin-like phospholipase/acyl hydrolase